MTDTPITPPEDEESDLPYDPRGRTLRWAIIMTRILVVPVLLEFLVVAWGVGYAVVEGPGAFSGWGVLILIGIVIVGTHGAPAGICVLIGWRMSRRRRLDVFPRKTALWGAAMGILYFFAPLIPLCFDMNADAFAFFFFMCLATWPALVFALLCLKLRFQDPERWVNQPADNA